MVTGWSVCAVSYQQTRPRAAEDAKSIQFQVRINRLKFWASIKETDSDLNTGLFKNSIILY